MLLSPARLRRLVRPMPPTPTPAMLRRSLGGVWPLPSTCRGTMVSPAAVVPAVAMKSRREMVIESPLELIPETQLNLAAIVGLRRHATEIRVGRVREARAAARDRAGLRVAEIRVVREVENLRPELQPLRPAQREVLEQRDVPLLLPRIVEQIAWGVAERARGRRRKRGGVEPEIRVASAGEAPARVGLRVAGQVVGLTKCAITHARDVVGAQHRKRRPAAEERRAGDLPPAQQHFHQRVLRLPEWQIVDVMETEDVTAIVARRSPVAVFVVGVEQHVALVAAVIHRLAKRV